MSMDLSVWSEAPFRLPALLPESGAWSNIANEWSYEGDGWQIVVMESEDQPGEAVAAKLPEATSVVFVTLEPIGAGRDGYRFLEKVVRALAKASNGVWVDPYGAASSWNEGTFE